MSDKELDNKIKTYSEYVSYNPFAERLEDYSVTDEMKMTLYYFLLGRKARICGYSEDFEQTLKNESQNSETIRSFYHGYKENKLRIA